MKKGGLDGFWLSEHPSNFKMVKSPRMFLTCQKCDVRINKGSFVVVHSFNTIYYCTKCAREKLLPSGKVEYEFTYNHPIYQDLRREDVMQQEVLERL